MNMKRFVLFASLLSSVALAAPAGVTHQKLGAERFSGAVVVAAAPDKVLAVASDAAVLGAAVGFTGGKGLLAKAGDSVLATRFDGDVGNLVVVLKKANELRIAFDPDNGSYICQLRVMVAPEGSGTKLSLEERYTESGAQAETDLVKQDKGYDDALAKLKAAAEKK